MHRCDATDHRFEPQDDRERHVLPVRSYVNTTRATSSQYPASKVGRPQLKARPSFLKPVLSPPKLHHRYILRFSLNPFGLNLVLWPLQLICYIVFNHIFRHT
jgi:hypothetical protein